MPHDQPGWRSGSRRGRARKKPAAPAVQPPRPEVSVTAPKPAKPYTPPRGFRTEATRPVTRKQRKAIDRGAARAQQAETDREVHLGELKARADELERTINEGKLPLVPKVRVEVHGDRLVAISPTLFGLSHSEQVVKQHGAHGFETAGPAKDKVLDTVPAAGKKVTAAGLKALEQTTRPIHAIAGGTKAAIEGKNVLRAAERGATLKDKVYFSDVLKSAGAPKWLQAAGGLTLDVAADPTTYATFGLSAPARQLAAREGQRVLKKALDAGMSEQGAQTVAKRAARRALEQAPRPEAKGLSAGVTVRGRTVATSGKTTAAIAKKTYLSTALKRLRESSPVQTAGRNLRPGFRPVGASAEQAQAVHQAQRIGRAEAAAGVRKAQQRAVAYARELSPGDHKLVIDALEGTLRAGGKKGLGALPEHLRPVARQLRDDFRYMNRLERQSGIAGGTIREYFPHLRRMDVEPPLVKAPGSGGRAAKLGSARSRSIRATLSELRTTDPSIFTEHVPLAFGTRAISNARGVADANFLHRLAGVGRRLTHDAEWDTGHEAVYRVTATGLKKAEKGGKIDTEEIDSLLKSGRGVILPKALADDALRGMKSGETPAAAIGRWYDRRLQGPVKTLLTVPNPQYHFTNLYGDLFNAYLGDTGLRSLVHSGRALTRLAKREAAAKTLGKQIDPTSKGVNIGGRKVGYDHLIKEAEAVGAIRSGFVGRDLPEILEGTARELRQKVGRGRVGRHMSVGRIAAAAHPIRAIRNLGEYREDFVRLGTYIEARKRGLSPIGASDRVARYHFDYGDLTDFERNVLRRFFPFYTFTARNTPLQLSRYLARPGKFATLEKVRQEGAIAAGVDPGYEGQLPDYSQRGLPIPIPGLHEGSSPLVLYPKLPATDLNRAVLNPGEQARQFMSMLSPILKTPVELAQNYQFFFGQPIDQLALQTKGQVHSRLPAPSWVAHLPKAVRSRLGIVDNLVDKRTGKRTWGWPAKLDYVVKLLPESSVATQLATSGQNRGKQDSQLKLLGYATGLKFAPFDSQDRALDWAYTERAKVDALMTNARQQGQGKRPDGSYPKAYTKLLKRSRELNKIIFKLKKSRGDKILPKAGAPPTGGSSGGWGGGGGGGWGG